MHLELIKNPDETQIAAYKIARVIYAETVAASLHVVEALASMISNASASTGRDVMDIISDKNMFESLNADSARHRLLKIDAQDRGFQMCLRVTKRMLRGGVTDCCHGATRFHRADLMPQWAVARGYIADIDGLLFYL